MFSASNSAGNARGDSAVATSMSPTSSQGNGVGIVVTPNTPAATENQQWVGAIRRNVTFAEPLHANAPDFSPMRYLNRGSEPDRQTHAANIGRAIRPIGSPTECLKMSDPFFDAFHEGPAFSTDLDMTVHGGRYVEIGNIDKSRSTEGFVEYAITATGMRPQLKGYEIAEGPGVAARLFVFFNDLRVAKNSKATFAGFFPNSTFRFVTLEEYFAADPKNFRAQLQAHFDGQVQFVARYDGPTRDTSLQLLFNVIHRHAQTYGEIRTISLQQPFDIGNEMPKIRVEYFRLTDADRACEPGEFKERLELDHNVLASCQEFFFQGKQGPFHRRRVVRTEQQSQRDLELQISMGQLGFSNTGGRSSGPVARRGAYSHQVPQNLRDEAPEYRNRAPRPRPQPFVSSGIHDDIDHEVIRASGPENIYKQPQTITLDAYKDTNDVRTTVMVRNIPNRLEAADLNDWLDETSKGMYDFSYLRVDFSNNCNVGYAFVNFVSAQAVAEFVYRREKQLWGFFNSDKTCEVSYATIQGQDCLIEKFRNSSVMQEWRGYRPKMWYSIDTPNRPADKNVGDEAPFPGPNNQSKLQRSLDNARDIGLYPPRHNMLARGRDCHPNRRSQYDRGTPRALLEDHAFANEHQMVNARGQALVEYHGEAPPGAQLYYVAPAMHQHGNQQNHRSSNRGYTNHGPNRGGSRGRGGDGRRRQNNSNHYRGDNY